MRVSFLSCATITTSSSSNSIAEYVIVMLIVGIDITAENRPW